MDILHFFNKKVPWQNRKSIYMHIKDNTDKHGNLTTEELPDSEIRYKDSKIRWVSGAFDGTLAQYSSSPNDHLILAKIIADIARFGRKKDKVKFYNIVIKDNIASTIDNVLEELVKQQVKITAHLLEWVEFLVLQSPDRGAVKTGIALIGAMGKSKYLEHLKVLGKHEEFTLYVAVALLKICDNPEVELWGLAKQVQGWGRIELVERLSDTKNPDIKAWILKEGYKNKILYEYLAYIAADTGGLKQALQQKSVDKKLLSSASDIIQALITEGPVLGISIYKDAFETISLYLKHTLGTRDNLMYLLTYSYVYDYITCNDQDWNKLKENGWTELNKNEMASLLKEELRHPKWKELVINSSSNDSEVEFWIVDRAAKILKIDFFNVHWQRLQEDPFNQFNWFDIMSSAHDDNIDKVLEFAIEILPLNKVATGSSDLLGLGIEYSLHACIDFIVQSLDKYEGKGQQLIMAALKSPVIRNRNMAIKALNNWNKAYINQDLKDAIREAKKVETEKDVKQRLLELQKNVRSSTHEKNDL